MIYHTNNIYIYILSLISFSLTGSVAIVFTNRKKLDNKVKLIDYIIISLVSIGITLIFIPAQTLDIESIILLCVIFMLVPACIIVYMYVHIYIYIYKKYLDLINKKNQLVARIRFVFIIILINLINVFKDVII